MSNLEPLRFVLGFSLGFVLSKGHFNLISYEESHSAEDGAIQNSFGLQDVNFMNSMLGSKTARKTKQNDNEKIFPTA